MPVRRMVRTMRRVGGSKRRTVGCRRRTTYRKRRVGAGRRRYHRGRGNGYNITSSIPLLGGLFSAIGNAVHGGSTDW